MASPSSNNITSPNKSSREKWTVLDLIQWGEDYFKKSNIELPRLNIESILAHVLRCKRLDLYVNYDKPLIDNELATVKQMLKARVAGKPLQYIIGEVDFYDTRLIVNENVLIPRPETELLVDSVIKDITKQGVDDQLIILDLGTGSGNIPIAIAKKIKNCKIFAADISSKALALAKKNAERNDVADRIQFFQADIMTDLKRSTSVRFDYIISNPPYISLADMSTLSHEVYDYEPHDALAAGKKGTEFFDRIITYYGNWLKNGGKLFFELGIGQDQTVKKMFMDAGFESISIEEDLHSIPRIIYASRIR